MNRTAKILALVATLFLVACAGMQARENVLMPAMKIAWVNISKNVEQGITRSLATDDITQVEAAGLRSEIIAMDSALASGIPVKVADVNWHRLHQIAKVGIQGRYDDDEIGFAVKKILMQRLERFHEAYVTLLKVL